ncbi:hypothetical protein MATL_G00191730 [Megalops atlanticus]|uniref:Uncharacterized protein n=1 Tax=Megalops atlanticus TaxID=7932 RepID=A0A9D3PNF2_MEGAT|nr:hypothetical protein MATL_G00191730 [Megalops atlanticus]
MKRERKKGENKGQRGQSRRNSGAMLVSAHLLLLLTLALQFKKITGGRAQRRQRLAEETLRPYLGRVRPEELCELLMCHSPIGSWCQVVQEGGIMVPKCVCPQTCPRQGAPVCSLLGKTYSSECLLHKEACRKRRRIGLAHRGPCTVSWDSCLSNAQRRSLAERRFAQLDRNRDGILSRRDLRKLHYKRMPLERCARPFFRSCDRDRNRKVTLQEWIACLVERSERWFHDFMSVKMGSRKLCPAADSDL